MTDVLDAIKSRLSVNNFDSSHTLSTSEIEELVTFVQEAPTSFNMQNWRVVAFSSPERKEALKAVAYGQAKVADAAVCFVFVGILDGYKELGRLWTPLVEAGQMDQGRLEGLVTMASGMYSDHAQFQRDEAIRSASLAAMTLMLAAEGKGVGSCPMIGFDPVGVAREAGLGENEIPVVMVAVGRTAAGNWARKPRRSLGEQLEIV